MFYDLPLEQLKVYRPERKEPADFDEFWQKTLSAARDFSLNPRFQSFDTGLQLIATYDVTFSGYGGQPVKAWLNLPRDPRTPVPCMVEYCGYGGGRSLPAANLLWSAAGYAHLIMDTRGQGSDWSTDDTPDPEAEGGNPHHPGFMTRGILKPETYYYQRVFTDAVRAVEAARAFDMVDAARVAVTGGSQGGGIAIAASGLVPDLSAALPDVPFLCHYKTATEITDAYPYQELVRFCKAHKDKVDLVFENLRYFDSINFASRAECPALFSVGLRDETCPPRTVYAAYNHYKGPKQMRVWEYNNHEGGGCYQDREKLKFMAGIWKP